MTDDPKKPPGTSEASLRAELQRIIYNRRVKQSDIARALGVSPQQVNQSLKGNRGLLTGMAERLLDFLEVDVVLVPRKNPLATIPAKTNTGENMQEASFVIIGTGPLSVNRFPDYIKATPEGVARELKRAKRVIETLREKGIPL